MHRAKRNRTDGTDRTNSAFQSYPSHWPYATYVKSEARTNMTTATLTPDTDRLSTEAGTSLFQKLLVVTGVAGLVLMAGWFIDDSPGKRQFYYSYLWGYTWALSIALGALFWNLIHHVTAAGWSVGIRRIWEN